MRGWQQDLQTCLLCALVVDKTQSVIELHSLLVLGRWRTRTLRAMLPVTVETHMPGRASLSTLPEVDRVRPVPRQMTRRRAFWREEWFLFVLFVAPNLLLFGIFSYWPMISNLYLSLVRWDMISPVKTFIGSGNYAYLFNDDTFRTVLKNS